MSNGKVYLSNLQSFSSGGMQDFRDNNVHKSKKVLVNPLIAGNNIHYNKGKYTIASSTFGVKESSANNSVWSDKIHYNPKFLDHNYAVLKKENVHINPNYLASSNGYLTQGGNYSVGNAIHVNPNFLSTSNAQQVYCGTSANKTSVISTLYNSSYVQNTSKYKYVRKNLDPVRSEKQVLSAPQKASEPKTVTKYKLVYSTAPSSKPASTSTPITSPGVMIKSKYSIRTCQINATPQTPVSCSSRLKADREVKKQISRDFTRISRTKLIRKSMLLYRKNKRKWLYSMFKANQRRMRYSKAKKQLHAFSNKVVNSSRASSECSSFQTYSRTKIVRKSVLRAQIDARKLLRKSLNSSVPNVIQVQPLIKSKYKLVRSKSSKSTKKPDSKLPNRRLQSFGKLKKRKSVIAKMTSKLRKNNQRCMFYNRFGRCKGKDKGVCNKIHDPLYIAICKRLPFGGCTDKNCLLSHDMRPGKMPTCYHYLAGLCKRDACPFLHIKVNPKAPICHSFLQGYCPDVFNCLKRHEYVCPIFAEKGNCSKGKSCAHPHKIPTVHSKLLGEDQRPLMTKKLNPDATVPKNSFSSTVESGTGEPGHAVVPKSDSNEPKVLKDTPAFTRYFAVPLSSETCDNDDESNDHSDGS